MINTNLGEKIRSERRKLRLTQSEVAEPEISKGMLSHIEKGITQPSMKTLQYIAKKLNKPVSYFIGDLESESPIFNSEIDLIVIQLQEADNCIKNRDYETAIVILGNLKEKYKIDGEIKINADILYRIAKCFLGKNEFDLGEIYLKQACDIYIKLHLFAEAAVAYIGFTRRYYLEHNYHQCIKVGMEAKNILKKSSGFTPLHEAEIEIRMMGVYISQGDIQSVISGCENIINIFKKNNIFYKIDIIYKMVASICLINEEYDKFLEYNEKAMRYSELNDNMQNKQDVLVNYALYMNQKGDPDNAMKLLEEYERLSNNFSYGYYIEKAKALYQKNQYNEALFNLEKLDYNDKIEYEFDQLYLYSAKIYEGLVYFKLQTYDKALNCLDYVIPIMEKYVDHKSRVYHNFARKVLKIAYENKAELESVLGDYKRGFIFIKKAIEIEKKIN